MWGAELHLVSPGVGYRAVLFLFGGLFPGEGMEAKPLPQVGNIAGEERERVYECDVL